jgi:hypothetical protein
MLKKKSFVKDVSKKATSYVVKKRFFSTGKGNKTLTLDYAQHVREEALFTNCSININKTDNTIRYRILWQ